MEWTRQLLIVPALFLCGCSESYNDTYEKPYATVCSGRKTNFFSEIHTDRLNERVNKYMSHGYSPMGNLVMNRHEVCQSLERMTND